MSKLEIMSKFQQALVALTVVLSVGIIFGTVVVVHLIDRNKPLLIHVDQSADDRSQAEKVLDACKANGGRPSYGGGTGSVTCNK